MCACGRETQSRNTIGRSHFFNTQMAAPTKTCAERYAKFFTPYSPNAVLSDECVMIAVEQTQVATRADPTYRAIAYPYAYHVDVVMRAWKVARDGAVGAINYIFHEAIPQSHDWMEKSDVAQLMWDLSHVRKPVPDNEKRKFTPGFALVSTPCFYFSIMLTLVSLDTLRHLRPVTWTSVGPCSSAIRYASRQRLDRVAYIESNVAKFIEEYQGTPSHPLPFRLGRHVQAMIGAFTSGDIQLREPILPRIPQAEQAQADEEPAQKKQCV